MDRAASILHSRLEWFHATLTKIRRLFVGHFKNLPLANGNSEFCTCNVLTRLLISLQIMRSFGL